MSLHLLRVSSQEMKTDSCTALLSYLMRQTSAGKPRKEHSLREVSCQRGPLLPAPRGLFLSRTRLSAEVLHRAVLFCSRYSEGALLLPAAPPSSRFVAWAESRAFCLLFLLVYLETPWGISISRWYGSTVEGEILSGSLDTSYDVISVMMAKHSLSKG